jgi:hypothetical protein
MTLAPATSARIGGGGNGVQRLRCGTGRLCNQCRGGPIATSRRNRLKFELVWWVRGRVLLCRVRTPVVHFPLVRCHSPDRPSTNVKVNRLGRPASEPLPAVGLQHLCAPVAFSSAQAIISALACRQPTPLFNAQRCQANARAAGRPRAGSGSLFSFRCL